MFEGLQTNFRGIFGRLGARRRVSEDDLDATLRDIRRALIEADVGLEVARSFCQDVRARALGAEILKSLDAHQVIVKVVHDALVELMGPVDPGIPINTKRGVTVLLMAGLQGSGKTTTCAKLARYLARKHEQNRPLLVAADLKRPGAIEQLATLGEQLGIPVYREESGRAPKVCARGVEHARQTGRTIAILDTAGRLAIDDELMDELADVAEKTQPDQTYLVCDGMLGQDAVRSARGFHERMALDGVILTKLDGDTRGGAALTVKAVVGKPIKWIGVGEQLEAFEEFRPEGMAQRILGMGDIVSLVTELQEKVDQEEALKKTRALIEGTYTFDDFLDHVGMIKKMGDLKGMVGKMPGGGALLEQLDDFDPKEFDRIEAMIRSMTFEERMRPELVFQDASAKSRRARIARGSGTRPADLLGMHQMFDQLQRMFGAFGRQHGVRGMAGRLMSAGARRRRRRRAVERGMLDDVGGGFFRGMMEHLGAAMAGGGAEGSAGDDGGETPAPAASAGSAGPAGVALPPGFNGRPGAHRAPAHPGRGKRTQKEKKRERKNRRQARRRK